MGQPPKRRQQNLFPGPKILIPILTALTSGPTKRRGEQELTLETLSWYRQAPPSTNSLKLGRWMLFRAKKGFVCTANSRLSSYTRSNTFSSRLWYCSINCGSHLTPSPTPPRQGYGTVVPTAALILHPVQHLLIKAMVLQYQLRLSSYTRSNTSSSRLWYCSIIPRFPLPCRFFTSLTSDSIPH